MSPDPQQPPSRMRRRPTASAARRASGGDPASRSSAAVDGDRRDFLRHGLAAGLAAGMPALLAGCGGGDDGEAVPEGHEQVPLFFNLSHLGPAGRNHFVVAAGRRHELVPTADDPSVLETARRTNAFLRDVPDAGITHHVPAAVLPTRSVTIAYQGTDLDAAAGSWSMAGVFFHIPPQASAAAYRHARAETPSGPLPMSAKRRLYGVRAAETEDDLRDETALIDTASFAAAMVGAHPDITSFEPNSARILHANYIDRDFNTSLLAEQLQDPQYGPAMPQKAAGAKNPTGWGTLRPVLADDGTPVMNTKGQNRGRIQYQPTFHPDVAATIAAAGAAIVPAVKNDASLGAVVTDATPVADTVTATLPDPAMAGKLWFRVDGKAEANPPPSAKMALKNGTPGNWLWPSATATVNDDRSVQVSIKLLNWGLRFLGVYVQFLSTKTDPPTVLLLKDIPEYRDDRIVPGHDAILDTTQPGMPGATDLFLGFLGPVFTVCAVPVAPGFLLPSLRLPATADAVRILCGGLAFSGPKPYPQTVIGGAVLTGVMNYGVTALMAAAGAGVFIPDVFKSLVPIASGFIQELTALILAAIGPVDEPLLKPGFWENYALVIAKALFTVGLSKGLKAFVAEVAKWIVEGTLQDSIPVAGWILEGVSVAVGVLSVGQTSLELALSPWTYVDELHFTHDLHVTLLKDANNASWPDADYYVVTALFDDGTPRRQRIAMPAAPPDTLAVTFGAVPLGGRVDVSVAFYRAHDLVFPDDLLLAKGSTGLVPNDASDAVPPLAIQQFASPIDAKTTYVHRRRTGIANGRHVWIAGPAPAVGGALGGPGGPGSIGARNAITVRQGTSRPPRNGYVGYAWRGQPIDPTKGAACLGGGSGQLDRLANLNTGDDPEIGSAIAACGLAPGVRVAYNLLSHGSANFYLDPSDPNAPVVRQVVLEPTPSIDPPQAGNAWGVLNFPSDALVLHPAGHLISVNTAAHKIETHRLPATSSTDATARRELRALVRSGNGTLPGLVTAPTHAVVAADGTLLVLEAGGSGPKGNVPTRLQAFDLGINPVPYFAKQPDPHFLVLAATPNDQAWTCLDIATEFTGYLYVLSYNDNAATFRLDVYHPTQPGAQPISTTTNFGAARIAVDFWRNVYAMNYEVLDPQERAEPGVSLWTPAGA